LIRPNTYIDNNIYIAQWDDRYNFLSKIIPCGNFHISPFWMSSQ
jgi:hypothetical protein